LLHLSKSWRISRIAIGALFTLAVVSVTGSYVARREMEKHSLVHSRRWNAMRLELTLCRTLLDKTSAAVTHSRERLGQLEFLGVTNGSTAHRATKDRWHNASVAGWDAAADDLVSLSQFSPASSEFVRPLLHSVEELLGAEIEVWRQIGRFAEGRAPRKSDEQAFEQIRHALREYRERERSYANALANVDVEFSRKAMEDNAELERSAEGALERSRTKLMWSGLGLAALGFAMACFTLYVCWLEPYAKRVSKTVLLANRTGT